MNLSCDTEFLVLFGAEDAKKPAHFVHVIFLINSITITFASFLKFA